MNEDYKLEIMNELLKRHSLRDAVKWLDSSMSKDGKTPADLMKGGQAKKVLNFLKKSN
jgi:hypothetical protein